MANIVAEPCTLVYTLLDDAFDFKDFDLIVRGLHRYQVKGFVANPENRNVHVQLNYQASVDNAYKKLGSLQPIIAVSKLSSFVKEDEFARLEQLRRQYGFGTVHDDVQQYQPPAYKPSRKGRGRGAGGSRAFTPRPAPYQRPSYPPQSPPATPTYQPTPGTSYETAQNYPPGDDTYDNGELA